MKIMSWLHKKPKPQVASDQSVGAKTDPVAHVGHLLWTTGRAFYGEYENIEQELTGEKFTILRCPILLESCIFFLFILDMALDHFNQTEDAREYIFNYCCGLLMGVFLEIGNKDQVADLIDARLRQYAEYRNKTNCDPDSFFRPWPKFNPVLNNMRCASQSDDSLPPLNCPVVIEDVFNSIALRNASNTAYRNISAPYRCALQNLFQNKSDIRLLTPADAAEKISTGTERGKTILRTAQGKRNMPSRI